MKTPLFYLLIVQYALSIAYSFVRIPRDKEALRITLQVTSAVSLFLLGMPLFYIATLSTFVASLIYDNLGINITSIVLSTLLGMRLVTSK